MSLLEIQGIDSLQGEINIQGSKNSILPILAATVLNKGISKIYGCPRILDVYHMIEILEYIGCSVTWDGNNITVNSKEACNYDIPAEFVTKMRSSFVFLGPLLGRFKNVSITYPGGCSIGARPIDIHIESLRKMNIEIDDYNDKDIINASTEKIIGNKIKLNLPSVGATENLMMAAVLAQGETYIYNAAREPEIRELANFLIKQGADIRGAGTKKIVIKGVDKLGDCNYVIAGDRIVAGTYLAAIAGVGGYATLKNVNYEHLKYIIKILRKTGCQVITGEDYITINRNPKTQLKGLRGLVTKPYPGFPTDMQSQIVVILSLAKGNSIIKEKIFESRFKIVSELNKMGANIVEKDDKLVIKGVKSLMGSEITAYELRGGAALIIAGLMADGKTILKGKQFIDRGYEDISGDLIKLGAKITEK